LLPASTGTGFAAFVTERSAESATCTFTVALLFPLLGSLAEETEAVWVIVDPWVTVGFTVTTNVNAAGEFAAKVVLSVQVKGDVVVQVQPAGPVNETNVVLAGNVSESTTALAAAGPRLVTVWLYVMLPPAVTGLGLPALVTLTSACVPDATAMLTVAELLFVFVSRDVVVTVAVSLMIVPAVAVPLTV